MKNRDDALIRKINEYCEEVEAAIDCFGDKEEFQNNKVFRNAACMPIMQIGELCKLISDELRNEECEIDWKGWCGIRDILAHQYTNIDYKKTWGILTEDLPALKERVSAILKEKDTTSIERIGRVIRENGIDEVDSESVFHRIVDGTGISVDMFSDKKLCELIRTINQ